MRMHYSAPDRKPLQPSHIYRDLRELLWPRRGLFTIGLMIILINRAAGLVLPWSTKTLIDDVVAARRMDLLLPLAAFVAVAVIVQAITSFSLVPLLSVPAQRLIADMRIRVQRHIGRLPVRYFDSNKTGVLVSRVMSDVEGVRNLVGTGLVEFVGGLFTAVLAFFFLIRINAVLTILAVIFMGIFAAIIRIAFGKVRPMFRERSRINAEVTGRLTESFGGVRVVKGFHGEQRESHEFSKGAYQLFEQVRLTMLAQARMGLASTLLMGVVSLTVMVVGGRILIRGEMSLGEFIQFTAYMGFMVAPVFSIVGFGTQITEAFAGLDRMHEVLAEQPEDEDPGRIHPLGPIVGSIRFSDVSFEYETGKPVLKNISFEGAPGTVTALVGPSGSGKSTLIGLVAAFAKPTKGSVLVDGVDLSAVSLDSYRSQLGVVLQDNFLFDGTIKENILFGRPDASGEDVVRAARIARVDEFAEKFEKQYETIVGERGVKLSGGQRQRVAIARAILASPRILILDEATSSLDSESEAYIQEGLAALMKGRTTFVIAHRMSTIRGSNQILVLEDGQIVERGTHEQLFKLGGRYFGLYTKQAGLESNRFLNPGERVPEEGSDDDNSTRPPRPVEVEESTRNLLGF
jgi:ABC-type multidrug transport system fused ATPase/permease subunit